jgi:hypothetical protein
MINDISSGMNLVRIYLQNILRRTIRTTAAGFETKLLIFVRFPARAILIHFRAYRKLRVYCAYLIICNKYSSLRK